MRSKKSYATSVYLRALHFVCLPQYEMSEKVSGKERSTFLPAHKAITYTHRESEDNQILILTQLSCLFKAWFYYRRRRSRSTHPVHSRQMKPNESAAANNRGTPSTTVLYTSLQYAVYYLHFVVSQRYRLGPVFSCYYSR